MGNLLQVAPIRKAILVVVFVLIFSSLGFTQSSVSLSDGKRTAVVLSDAARYFGADVSWRPAEGKLILIHANTQAQVLIGGDRVLIDDFLLVLSAPARARDGAVFVRIADAAAILSRLTGHDVTESEIISAGLAVDPDAPGKQAAVIEGLRYVSYPDFTRFIITLKDVADVGAVEVDTTESDRALSISLANARFARREPSMEVNDGVVGRVDFMQDGARARLLATLRPDSVSSEIQKFNEPARIVLDLRPKGTPLASGDNPKNILPAPDGPIVEPSSPRPRLSLTTIVIDPGHGGRDRGARGRGGLVEKEVTLDIALRLKRLVENTPGMKVVLTRIDDSFVSLEERTIIANSARDGKPADLFISIHTNSHKSSDVDGFEAFYISDKFDPGAEATAAMENAVIAFEQEGKNGDSSLSPILWDLQFTEFISESSELAFIAQEKLGQRLSSRNRGVRQAKFIVLSGVAMPSVLLEVGFISNRVEEAEMKTGDYKDKCAEALADAIFHFKKRHDARLGLLDGKTTH